MSVNDVRCLRKLEVEVKIADGKYVVPVLWKEECKQLPDNYAFAEQRLEILQKRFEEDKKLFQKYKKATGTDIS